MLQCGLDQLWVTTGSLRLLGRNELPRAITTSFNAVFSVPDPRVRSFFPNQRLIERQFIWRREKFSLCSKDRVSSIETTTPQHMHVGYDRTLAYVIIKERIGPFFLLQIHQLPKYKSVFCIPAYARLALFNHSPGVLCP